MGLGQKLIEYIHRSRDKKQKKQPGDIGRFWRDGGNQLLYDVPVKTGDLIIDAGGYKGEWSIGMVSRYGCRCVILEPVPEYFGYCKEYFQKNELVHVERFALGGVKRTTSFFLLENGTSEHVTRAGVRTIDVDVIDITDLLARLDVEQIACLKLNIEGGEYEVLERLIDSNMIHKIDSLLIQFHRQPADYEDRYDRLLDSLKATHELCWSYYMVWEKWVRKVSLE